jgi:hypothetical protein
MSDDKNLLDEVMHTTEDARPNRREHAKAEPRPDPEELEHCANIERDETGLPEEPETPET